MMILFDKLSTDPTAKRMLSYLLIGLVETGDTFEFDVKNWKDLPFLDKFIKILLNEAIPNLHGIFFKL